MQTSIDSFLIYLEEYYQELEYEQKLVRQRYMDYPYYHDHFKNYESQIAPTKVSFTQTANGGAPLLNYHLTSMYDIMSLHYTAGVPLESISAMHHLLIKSYEHLAEVTRNVIQLPNYQGPLGIRGDYPGLYYEEYINIMSMAVLLNQLEGMPAVLQCFGHRDKMANHFIHHFIDSSIEIDNTLSTVNDTGYQFFFIKAINAPDEDSTLKFLHMYLGQWYKGQQSIGSRKFNSHLKKELGYQCAYRGYWAFEAAALVVKKNLDDSSLHKYVYYPKDIVSFSKKRVNNTPNAGSDASQQWHLWGGQKVPIAGYWICPNMLENDSRRKQYFRAGDLLPEGRSEKGRFVWLFIGQ